MFTRDDGAVAPRRQNCRAELWARSHTAGMDEVSVPAAVVSSEQSSELLGYPPDARLLIINCDDFGMYPAINAAVIESVEEGIASSCSLMVPCPGAPEAMKLLSRRPQIPFGIHLTLVCEMPGIPWGPVVAKERVPSLLDAAGALFSPTPAGRATLLGRARLDEIELEFRAQIDAVADAGLTPTHLDFHCLADGGRDDILDLAVVLAAEYGLAVRVWLEPGRQAMRRRGLPVTDNDFVDSFSLGIEARRPDTLRCCVTCLPGSMNGRCIPVWATRSRRPSTVAGPCAGRTTSS